MIKIYPQKETWLGTHTVVTNDRYKEAKERLQKLYDHDKAKHEKIGDKVWCNFDEPEFIYQPSSLGSDPLTFRGTIGIKWRVKARAFYILRNFKGKKEVKRYFPCKKGIPKKKWGKIWNG